MKGANSPSGRCSDVYAEGYEFMAQSTRPAVSGRSCNLSGSGRGSAVREALFGIIFNISAMSFGSLSANAILALNKGAKLGGFSHDTGEGSISRYHREHGGDLIWELGSGYFGCRTADGNFDPGLSGKGVVRTGQNDRDQAQPGRQAWPRRDLARGKGDGRDSRRHEGSQWARIVSRRLAIEPFPRRSK